MNHLFYSLSDPMLIIEADESRWFIRDVNQAFVTLSGFKQSVLSQLDASSIISTGKAGVSFAEAVNKLANDQTPDASLECELVTKASMPATVSISCRMFQLEQQTMYVVICKDLREANWIDEFIVNNKVMISATVDERFIVSSFKHYYAPVQQSASAYAHKSFFDLVSEQEHSKLKQLLDGVKNNRNEAKASFQLKLGDEIYYADAIIKPFYYGNRSFKNFLIAITNLQLNAQEDDPSFKLRMLMLSKNISATSLAQSTLISLTTISKIRTGKIKKPQRLTAELIAGELGVRPETIWSSFKR